jgi:hypothetical protein
MNDSILSESSLDVSGDFVAPAPASVGKTWKVGGEDSPWKNKVQLKAQPRRALFRSVA